MVSMVFQCFHPSHLATAKGSDNMPTLSLSFKKPHVGIGEMAQWLRSRSVVAEDLSSVPIPTLRCLQSRSPVASRLSLETFPPPCEQTQALPNAG